MSKMRMNSLFCPEDRKREGRCHTYVRRVYSSMPAGEMCGGVCGTGRGVSVLLVVSCSVPFLGFDVDYLCVSVLSFIAILSKGGVVGSGRIAPQEPMWLEQWVGMGWCLPPWFGSGSMQEPW